MAALLKPVIHLRANNPIGIIFPALVRLLRLLGLILLTVSPDPIAVLFGMSVTAYMI
jgi:hypothetical protein